VSLFTADGVPYQLGLADTEKEAKVADEEAVYVLEIIGKR